MAQSFASNVQKLLQTYQSDTTPSLKIIDVYLVFLMLTGIIQFVYVLLVGTFPFNSFLAGFIATVANFVLGVSLRMQTNPKNKDFAGRSEERAFAEFLFCTIVLNIFVVNFLG